MQTFLPYPSFEESAKVLDRRRLNSQRKECLQIALCLIFGGSWSNHPVVKMWSGHEYSLSCYGIVVAQQWRSFGYKDTVLPKLQCCIGELSWRMLPKDDVGRRLEGWSSCGHRFHDTGLPGWFGDSRLHDSHKRALVAKNPEHYSNIFIGYEPVIDYYYPYVS